MNMQKNTVQNHRERIKSSRRKRIRKRILLACILALSAATVLISVLVTRPSKYQTGKEWLEKQEYYMESLTTLIKDTDDVAALYLDGDIAPSDVMTHIAIFRQEIVILKYDYNRYYREHPLKVGTSDYYESKGIDAAFNCLVLYEQLLDTMEKVYDDKDKLAYIYLAYQQKFNESVTIYSYCKDMALGENHTEEQNVAAEGASYGGTGKNITQEE